MLVRTFAPSARCQRLAKSDDFGFRLDDNSGVGAHDAPRIPNSLNWPVTGKGLTPLPSNEAGAGSIWLSYMVVPHVGGQIGMFRRVFEAVHLVFDFLT